MMKVQERASAAQDGTMYVAMVSTKGKKAFVGLGGKTWDSEISGNDVNSGHVYTPLRA
jgi:hypothetical protein